MQNPGIKTINPEDPTGPFRDIYFPIDLVMGWYKNDPIRFANTEVAKFVLENPCAIFRGIREHKKGGYCYVGLPAEWCVAENVKATFPKDKVFCVYVNPAMFVYDFRAEKSDPAQECMPENPEGRFKEKLWPLTS